MDRVDGKVPDRIETSGKITYELICYAPQVQQANQDAIDVTPEPKPGELSTGDKG